MLGDAEAGTLIVAGPLVRLACERHLRDRAEATWHFSAPHANLWIDFYERTLRLPDVLDGDGQPMPFILEPALVFILGSLMGWIGADGNRRFREGYCEMGKGNAKTPLLAGLGLGGLLIDGEAAPEIYAAATTRDQAEIMFRDAYRMAVAARLVKTDDNPDGVITVSGGDRPHTLTYGLGFFKAYSRDQGVKSGPRPHMALIDEVHEHPSADVINKLRAGFKFRKQPLAVEITNSGFDRTSICWQHRQHAENVLRGLVQDDRLFAYVCALDEGDDPMVDRSCWIKTNPLLGVTVTEAYLERQVQNGLNIQSEFNTVLRLNFCIWTYAENRAIDMGQWAGCRPMPTDAGLVGKPCYGGLDLGATDDLSAFAKVWDMGDGLYVAKLKFWIPEGALTKFPNRPYDAWRRAGVLTITRTNPNTTDYDTIEADVASDCKQWGVREVAYDRKFAEHMAQHLLGHGLTMVETPQGFALNEPIRLFLKSVSEGKFCHGNDPILAWMAGNLVTRDGLKGDIRIDKDSSPEKIDGLGAVINAFDRVVRQPRPGTVEYFREL